MALFNRPSAPDDDGAAPPAPAVEVARRKGTARRSARPARRRQLEDEEAANHVARRWCRDRAGRRLSYIFSGSDPKAIKNDPTQPIATKIATDDMVGKNMADKAWRAQAEVLQSEQSQRLKTVEGEVPKVESMQQQIADLQQQNAAMKANGEKVLQVMDADSKAKAAQIEALRHGGGSGPGPQGGPGGEPFRVAGASAPTYGAAGGYDAQGHPLASGYGAGTGQVAGMPTIAEVKTISFGGAAAPGARRRPRMSAASAAGSSVPMRRRRWSRTRSIICRPTRTRRRRSLSASTHRPAFSRRPIRCLSCCGLPGRHGRLSRTAAS